MASDAQRLRNRARRLHFSRVPLAVLNRERVEREAVGFRDGCGRVRVEASAEQYDGLH
jgi:hypothetical protein